MYVDWRLKAVVRKEIGSECWLALSTSSDTGGRGEAEREEEAGFLTWTGRFFAQSGIS